MPVAPVPADLIGSSGLYNSVDPFLRRLRLDDPNGAPVTDLAKAFAEVEVLVVYAGSAEGSNNLVELHKSFNHLLKHQKSAALIYVSTDVDPKLARAVPATQPWYRMTFYDDSDFAPLAPSAPEVSDVARGEDFVHAGEIETEAEVVTYGTTESPLDYVRPLSRAAVSMTINTFQTPSIAIYNLNEHRFLAYNVKERAFQHDRVPKNFYEWKKGSPEVVTRWDMFKRVQMQVLMLVAFAIYQIAVYFGGEKYDFVPKLFALLSERINGAPQVATDAAAAATDALVETVSGAVDTITDAVTATASAVAEAVTTAAGHVEL